MVNIWVGKQVGPELDELAKRESGSTGHSITRIDLGRELFLWALELYRKAGSLARLKSMHIFTSSPRYSEEVQARALESLEEIFRDAPSAAVEQVVQTLARLSSRQWSKATPKKP